MGSQSVGERGRVDGPGRGEVEEDGVGAHVLVVEREAALVRVAVRHAHDAREPVLGDLAPQVAEALLVVLEAKDLAEPAPPPAPRDRGSSRGGRGRVAGEDGAGGRVREGA